jgi:hypothetical protein
MTKTDFAVHVQMHSKLQERVKDCTVPILADKGPVEKLSWSQVLDTFCPERNVALHSTLRKPPVLEDLYW